MPGKNLCLLSFDGGGVRGQSSLQILKQLMDTISPDSPPKPCDYFDMIGGTSTGRYVISLHCGLLRITANLQYSGDHAGPPSDGYRRLYRCVYSIVRPSVRKETTSCVNQRSHTTKIRLWRAGASDQKGRRRARS